MAESQRPVPRVPAPPHEGHAEDRERAVLRTAPPGRGDEEERPGIHTQTQTTLLLLCKIVFQSSAIRLRLRSSPVITGSSTV